MESHSIYRCPPTDRYGQKIKAPGWSYYVVSVYEKDGVKAIDGVVKPNSELVEDGFLTRHSAQERVVELNTVEEVLES